MNKLSMKIPFYDGLFKTFCKTFLIWFFLCWGTPDIIDMCVKILESIHKYIDKVPI